LKERGYNKKDEEGVERLEGVSEGKSVLKGKTKIDNKQTTEEISTNEEERHQPKKKNTGPGKNQVKLPIVKEGQKKRRGQWGKSRGSFKKKSDGLRELSVMRGEIQETV